MRAFKDIPIRQKLIQLMMLTCTVVLLITCSAFIIYELLSYRDLTARNLSTVADIIANNSTATLRFDDPNVATEILSALQVEPNVVAAGIYKGTNLFASYPPGLNVAKDLPVAPALSGARFSAGTLELYQPVVLDGENIGTVYIRSSLEGMYDRLQLYGLIVALVLAASFVTAFLLSNLLQHRISQPILELANVAKTVSENQDYSVRAKTFGQDELGFLTEAFNLMLTQIHERDVALQESGERLRLALKASQTGTWDWDVVKNKLRWDEFTQSLFGLNPEAFSATSETFLSRVHPDDREHIKRSTKSAMQEHRELDLEFRVIWPDGSIHYMATRGRALCDDDGRLTRMTGVCIDVTKRKKDEEAIRASEERYRSLVAAMTSVVWMTNSKGAFVVPQPSWERYTGQSWRDQQDWGWLQMIHPDDRDLVKRRWTQALAKKLILEYDGRIWHAESRQYRYFVARVVPLLNSDGAVREWVGTLTDVDDRKRAEDEIRRLNAELELRVQERTAELTAANKDLEAFTYSVSHDLRAPLRHIDGFARILQEEFSGNLDAAGMQFIQRIRKGTQNMGQLVDDLLNFSRVGRQELKRQLTPLDPIVDEIVASLKLEIGNRALVWEIEPLPAVACDPALVKQVFTNLLSNAVKYSRPREKPVVRIGTAPAENQTIFYVADNGVGFEMKYAHKLFGVFQRLHRTEDFEGTGVGLATVQRIIQKHGGRIWAEAAPDQGATFYFTLEPLDKRPPAIP